MQNKTPEALYSEEINPDPDFHENKANPLLEQLVQQYSHLGKHHNQKGKVYPEWLRERREKFKGCGNRTKKGLINDMSCYKTKKK